MAISGHYKSTKGTEVEKIGNWLSVKKDSEQNIITITITIIIIIIIIIFVPTGITLTKV